MTPRLEYIPQSHQYVKNGVIVPSVTKIVNWKFPIYKGVPQYVLKRKADYGNRVHDLCEKIAAGKMTAEDVKDGDEDVYKAVTDFQLLMDKYCFFPKSMEEKISYKNRYAGTYDILTKDDILIDLKTTSVIHVDNETKQAPLNLQLSLYAMAMKRVEEAWYIWLPKGKKAKCEKVALWSEEELLKLLDEYQEDTHDFTK